ncbi:MULTISPECIES: YybH family protein [unclassified Streptomyces]|uniref:YybH family protein n=1 Tax=unclassified Streptomyces TaxID=2593676 RepID=UPI001908E4D8|nr:DUF4440 domain-containing protein [Streptomyces sp. HSG2]
MAVSDPAQLPKAFVEAFNDRDLGSIDRLFEPDAVRVLTPGVVVTGDRRRQATSDFLALGLPIDISVRHVYVHDDIALIVGDFLIDGVGPDGEPVHVEGTATDVARRGADGLWRYAIDNPPGVERG